MISLNSHNVLRHEIIGLQAKGTRVSGRRISTQLKVIDETRNTVVLSTGSKRVIVPKAITTFHFSLPTGEIAIIEGRRLLGRPEDRIKAQMRQW